MLNAPTFDVAIIGGGPAGAAAAITSARAGARVLLLEAREFPRHKVCGEFVSAEALELLAELLKFLPGSRAWMREAPLMNRTRLFLGCRTVEAPVSPPAVSITRYKLDAALWEAAKVAGVTTLANTEAAEVQGEGPFQVRGSAEIFTSRALVIAAGRWSQFTPDRELPPGPRWIGIKAHFREPNPSSTTDLYFFDDGYCGVQPVGDGLVNACAMVRSDRATSLSEVFALQERLAERAATWTPAMKAVTTAPLVYRKPQATRSNVVFVGDAAGFIDPFVGDGISIALRSGRIAAQCLNCHLSGGSTLPEAVALYEREYTQQFAPLLANAARVRSLLSLPTAAQAVVFELLRLPGMMPMVIRKTRRVG